ncbi:hypothetical protein ScPMuIL_014666 [Solemya velum]
MGTQISLPSEKRMIKIQNSGVIISFLFSLCFITGPWVSASNEENAMCLVNIGTGTLQPQYYNKGSHLCCNKHLSDRVVNGKYQECCNRTGGVWEPYSSETKICCGVYLENITNKDGKTYACCHHTQQLYLPEDECCGTEGCCGGVAFDPTKFQCFNGREIIRKIEDFRCGGQKIGEQEQCCGGRIIDSKSKCCGEGELPPTHVCCLKSQMYGQRSDKMIPKQSITDNECCVSYSENTPYNSYRSRCLSGKVVPLTVDFCGRSPYDISKDLCCKNTKLHKGKKETGFTCCRQSYHAFGPGQICCRGIVYNKTKSINRCQDVQPTTRLIRLPNTCKICNGQRNRKSLSKKETSTQTRYSIRIRSVRKGKKGYIVQVRLMNSFLKKPLSSRISVPYTCQCEPKVGRMVSYSSIRLTKEYEEELRQKVSTKRKFRRFLRRFVISLMR